MPGRLSFHQVGFGYALLDEYSPAILRRGLSGGQAWLSYRQACDVKIGDGDLVRISRDRCCHLRPANEGFRGRWYFSEAEIASEMPSWPKTPSGSTLEMVLDKRKDRGLMLPLVTVRVEALGLRTVNGP